MSKHTASAAGGAMPAERETFAAGFLRLMALRQSIEKTLGEMAALLGDDLVGEPDGVAVRAPVGGYLRREG